MKEKLYITKRACLEAKTYFYELTSLIWAEENPDDDLAPVETVMEEDGSYELSFPGSTYAYRHLSRSDILPELSVDDCDFMHTVNPKLRKGNEGCTIYVCAERVFLGDEQTPDVWCVWGMWDWTNESGILGIPVVCVRDEVTEQASLLIDMAYDTIKDQGWSLTKKEMQEASAFIATLPSELSLYDVP